MYYVSNDVDHGCCYHASVKFKHNETDKEEQHICECQDEDTAKMIADALNRND